LKNLEYTACIMDVIKKWQFYQDIVITPCIHWPEGDSAASNGVCMSNVMGTSQTVKYRWLKNL
jgi:hypothetical protein